ncbi:MAG: hypothetical protein WAN14_06750 [Candidatus Acidiferrales bacterium]
MSGSRPKTFLSGAGLVWKWQRLVWWIFAVTLIFGFLSTQGMVDRAAGTLNHSFASKRLVDGWDASAVTELMQLPNSPIEFQGPAVIHFSIVFAVFMLFLTGGILTTYLRDKKPHAASFFEACGQYFWRFFRLLIYFAIVLIPIGAICAGVGALYDKIDADSISPFSAVYFFAAAAIVVLLLFAMVRLWFDMAEVIAVADDERRMHRALRRAARVLWHNFFSLLWLYVSIAIIGLVLFFFGLRLWMTFLAPQSNILAFLLSQLMILAWIGTRLWQRASEALWYREYAQTSVREPIWTPSPTLVTQSVATNPES